MQQTKTNAMRMLDRQKIHSHFVLSVKRKKNILWSQTDWRTPK